MKEQLREWAGARCFLHKTLAGFYLGVPARQEMEIFLDRDFLGSLSGIFGPEALAPFHRCTANGRWDYDTFKQEYTKLFITPTGKYVTPYENVYRGRYMEGDKEVLGLLQGPYTIQVIEHYRRAGMDIDRDVKDLPDFVGLEFAFMQRLCDKEMAAWDADRDEEARRLLDLQKSFLKEHLCRWVPDLCARILKNTSNEFISGMALLTQAFLRIETETLECMESPSVA